MLYVRRRLLTSVVGHRSRAIGANVRWLSQWKDDGDEEDDRVPRLYRRADSEMVIMNKDEKSGYDELVEMLQREQMEAAQVKVPWFLEQMPDAYFKQVSPELRDQHLSAVVALYDFDAIPDITLNSNDGKTLSMINGGALTPEKLKDQLKKLPVNAPLAGMQVFNSLDEELSVNIFQLQDSIGHTQSKGYMTAEMEEYIQELMQGKYSNDPLHAKPAPYFEKEYLSKFLETHCTHEYVVRSSPRRFCKQLELYHHILAKGEDEVGIDIESNWGGNPHQSMVTLAITNVLVMAAIRRITEYCASKNLNIVRTHLDVLRGPGSEAESQGENDVMDLLKTNKVAMFRILVEPSVHLEDQKAMDQLNARLLDDLPTVSKWIDDRAVKMITSYGMSAREGELVIALCDVAHAIMAPKDPFEFARSNIESVVTDPSRMDYTREIIDIFMKRFDPAHPFRERGDDVFKARLDALRNKITESGELRNAQDVLCTILDIVEGVKRTNLFVPNRFGVSFRLDPGLCVRNILDGNQRYETPYGVFFVHGRRFSGFHVRFRDIARGGLRIVTPRNKEMHGVESARQLVECYDLSFAQQLKNKDIAEGGAKAVCLVDVEGFHGFEREHVMRKSLKAMVNSILDIIPPNDKNSEYVVDHMDGIDEFIYFGPDEQVTPEHINWIVKRAGQRQYPMPAAFMSSKPDAGINHKEFGVTSEGVAVFLDEALRATGVDTTKPFTVKLTGGPDGDVAGNMLKILHREYGENARVVGLADGSASVEDPDGLHWDELLRLFHGVLPLSDIDRSKLGPRAEVHLCDTPAGINKRNTMHNRVKADAFVPAGGRPATINDSNWEKYLLADGTPSSPLIVEGANLFLTPFARERLSEKGCVIVKDSSANKCGVICSSFEIIASMLLSKEEFLANKPLIVKDVLEGLRTRAQMEAQLMFREYKSNPSAPLPPVSQRISYAINRSTDSFAALLETLDKDEYQKLLPVIRQHLPKALMDLAWDRFQDRVPEAYIRFQLASILASQLVYKEGVSYAMSIDDEVLGQWLLRYLEKAIQMDQLAHKFDAGESLSVEEKSLMSNILRQGGARTMVDHHLD